MEQQQESTLLHGELAPELKSYNEIYLLIEQFAESIRNGNIDDIMSYYADDVVAFDMMPPLAIESLGHYRSNWEKCFTSYFIFPINYNFKNPKIDVCGELATSRALVNFAGTSNSSESMEMWMRSTLVFKKVGGEWKIVHEHTSVPFDDNFKGMTTLSPDGGHESYEH